MQLASSEENSGFRLMPLGSSFCLFAARAATFQQFHTRTKFLKIPSDLVFAHVFTLLIEFSTWIRRAER